MSEEEKASEEQKNIDKELKNSKPSKKDEVKTHGEILKQQIIEGQKTYDKSTMSIFLSSFTAGLEIGFSYLLICSVFFFFSDKVSQDTVFKITALVYPVGFIMVILGQSILFTEQTSLLTLPVLNKKRSLVSLLKLWGIVIIGNVLGGYLISFVIVWIGPRLGIFNLNSIEHISRHAIKPGGWALLISSVLAGWLMGLLSWLVAASRDTLSRIFFIYMITCVLSFAGLHHSIVGNVEVFSGLVTSYVRLPEYFSFQGISLLGNALGGAVFVALLKYRAFVSDVRG